MGRLTPVNEYVKLHKQEGLSGLLHADRWVDYIVNKFEQVGEG